MKKDRPGCAAPARRSTNRDRSPRRTRSWRGWGASTRPGAGSRPRRVTRRRGWPSYLRLAEAHLATGQYEAAAVDERRARDVAESLGDAGGRARALRALADAGVETADDGAEALYRELERIACDLHLRPLQAHAHLDLGRLAHRAGRPGEAADHLATAIAMFSDMGMTHWVERASALSR